MPEQIFRGFNFHERFHVIRSHLGAAPVVSLVAVGKGGDDVMNEIKVRIQSKISTLLSINTLLSCHIHGSRTSDPRYARNDAGISVDQILFEEEVDTLDPSTLITAQVKDAETSFADLSKAPLWNVKLLRLKGRQDDRFAVALNTHHIIIDGRGLANLFEVLLSPSDELPEEKRISGGLVSLKEVPPKSDDSVENFQIGWIEKAIIRTVFSLPKWAQPSMAANPKYWPMSMTKLAKHPKDAERVNFVSTLRGRDVLSNLKEQANKHGIKTIHPLIHMSAVMALYAVLPRGTHVEMDAAVNERIPEQRHTLITGNYVSIHMATAELKDDIDIWQHTRAYAEGLIKGRVAGRRVFGRYSFVLPLLDDKNHKPTETCPTALDLFFRKRLEKENPFSGSLGLSNLGAIQNLHPCFDTVFWSQQHHTIVAPITINVNGFGTSKKKDVEASLQPKPIMDGGIGAKATENPLQDDNAGLSLSVSMRKGVIGQEIEEKFTPMLLKALRAFEAGIEEGTSMVQIMGQSSEG